MPPNKKFVSLKPVPTHEGTLDIPAFKTFLAKEDGTVMQSNNPYEIIRFKIKSDTGILYRKKTGYLTWNALAKDAYSRMINAHVLGMLKTTKKKKGASRLSTVRSIVARHGNRCFFCLQEMAESEMTIEHILATSLGGRNVIANKAVAHALCNERAGNLSIMEKIAIRDEALIKEMTR